MEINKCIIVKNNLVPAYTSDLYHCNTSKNNLRKADDLSLSMANIVQGTHDLLFGLNCISPSNPLNQLALLKDK